MRITAVVTMICLGVVGLACADQATASMKQPTEIPPQKLGSALATLAKKRQFQVLYRSEIVGDTATRGASGDLTLDETLRALLSGTGLSYRFVDENTIKIFSATSNHDEAGEHAESGEAGGPQGSVAPVGEPYAAEPDGSHADAAVLETKRSFWSRFRLAQTEASPQTTGGESNEAEVAEVIVTAQKKAERLHDVPMSITALGGDELVRSQSHRLEDYVGKVPGLTLVAYNGLGSQLVIRGVSSGSVPINGSVANYIDETPFTTQGPFAGSYISAPNLDTFDIQRIEVLRGPQGTLYGANALAGLMKYVTNPPDLSGFKTTVEAGASSVAHGGSGYELRGMVNLPLSEKAALRLVAYDSKYPGFIDDPRRGLQDANDSRFSGSRASLLFQATDTFSIRLSALYQERQWDDYPNVDVDAGTLALTHGGLIQEKFINNRGRAITEVFNATVNWDLGFGNIVSTTSYHAHKPKAIYSYPTLDGLIGTLFGAQFAGAAVDFEQRAKAFTQEVRLASNDEGRLSWQLGGYHTNESADQVQNLEVIDVAANEIVWDFPTVVGDFHIPVTYKEYAGFANVTYRFSPTLDASVGARYSKNDQTFHETQLGLFGGPDIDNATSEDVFTYSGDLRWHISPASMAYARIASGFVPGGPNLTFAGADLPTAYDSSTTINYEIGFKSSLLDNHLTTELSVFDIEWSDIQLLAVFDNGLSGITNGGKARSRGAEWNLTYVPARGLTLNLNGSYTDAHLTEATPASVNGQIGDSLPAVARWQSSASASYEWPVAGQITVFAGANWRYSGSRKSDFIAGSPRQSLPGFSIIDVRAGIENERWSLALYVKNVANEHALLYVQPLTLSGGLGRQEATLYTPRTIGATVTASFK